MHVMISERVTGAMNQSINVWILNTFNLFQLNIALQWSIN